MRWRERDVRDIILNPSSIGIKVNPEDIFLLNVRSFYILLGIKFSQEELTKEKFIDLYYKFLKSAENHGFQVEMFDQTINDNWINNQLERINFKRDFAQEINTMLNENK